MLKFQICLAWLILSCGQVLLWRRRDNVLGYLQAGFFFVSIIVPVLGTTVLDDADQTTVGHYADIMLVGVVAYLPGLCFGAFLGDRWRLPNVVFARRLADVPALLIRRTRQLSLAGLIVLMISFLLLGYIPYFAADRVSAKYGVGANQAGYERGSLVLHLGLIIASTVLPVTLALVLRQGKRIDIVLAGALFVALTLTLSRRLAFIGPLVFLIAFAVERGWRAWRILAAVCIAFVASTIFNEIVSIAAPVPQTTFASRVAASAPDVDDHVDFLSGFEAEGGAQLGLKPLLATLSLNKGPYDPARYALRVRTGLPDISNFAAGGVRLPAPLWGYVSFGYPGVILWSLLSGIAIGAGTSMLRRLLSDAHGGRWQCLNIVLAWVFFGGTFQLIAAFYVFERVALVSFAMTIFLCSARRQSHRIEAAASSGSGAQLKGISR